ncbi:MAG: hypothetical protein Q9209_000171 [Squamulea sp. 1 TL-2023]
MAPFRRGQSNLRNSSSVSRGASARVRDGSPGGFPSQLKPQSKNAFQASRVRELVDDRSESPDTSAQEIDNVRTEADELSSHDDDSEPDAPLENPYGVLLQTLNPTILPGEPRRKRRKVETTTTSAPLQESPSADPDAVNDFEDLGNSSDERSVDDLDIATAQEEHDFFAAHFAEPDEDEISLKIHAIEKNQWTTEKLTASSSWSARFRRPITTDEKPVGGETNGLRVQDLNLKPKFGDFLERILSNADDLTHQLATSIFTYCDVLFSARSLDNASKLRTLTSLHILNHLIRTRDKILKNNAKISSSSDDEDLGFRDQGFTRPKVLILLPTRQSCVKMVDAIVDVGKPDQQGNRKRFEDSFANVDEELSPGKPEDFKDLFGGNDDDMFRMGLKLGRKTVKYFSQFYSSDIIFASPLGLRTILVGDGKKKADYDFLSSIEIVVLDQSEALLMQNWEHLEYIFEHLNLQPKEAHGCDFSRVRGWYLDGHAKYFRQTISFSAFNFPALNKLYTKFMLNFAGKTKLANVHNGAIVDLAIPVKQTFSRFAFIDPASEPDDRFNYFTTAILPALIKTPQMYGGQRGIFVFMPLYADFVRIRNHLAASSTTQHVSFGSISEYTPVRDVARARSHFLTGRHSMLLYTERAHHFRRYRLKGISRIIFYGLPENPLFYKEIVSDFLSSDPTKDHRHTSVRCLFSRLDLLKLERIVGSQSWGYELTDMAQQPHIESISSHDRVLSGDTCCQSLSDYNPNEIVLGKSRMPDKSKEEREEVAGHKTSAQLGYSIDSHPQKALLDTLKQETEDLLRTPLTPISSDAVSEHGFPLGVEVARNAYSKGLLSTGTFYSDCLPPALSVLKCTPSLGETKDTNDPPNGAFESSENCPRQDQTESNNSRPVVRRRNLTHDAQLRRLNQAPLSAIFEEPARSQYACACGLCSESDNGRSIVWFHLCPRYAAIARENGITYEPCEGRVIMHHGLDRSSVGLIIEGPMEDRFVPITTLPQLLDPQESDKVQSCKPGDPDLRALCSATGRAAARNLPHTMNGPNFHQLPSISTPALQRPISPATQVSQPTSLNPLYPAFCPKQKKNAGAHVISHTAHKSIERLPAVLPTESEINVHPALRTGVVLPVDWSRSPSRIDSHALSQEQVFEPPHTPVSKSPRCSSNYSDFSGERPVRTSSLGAPSHRRPSKNQDMSSIDHPLDSEEILTHIRARHQTSSTSSSSVISPFSSHERTPSVFLGPTTPSTASFQRSSISSYGDPLPSPTCHLKPDAASADTMEARLTSPFPSDHYLMNYDTGEDSFSPQLSYHTAPDSHYAQSSPLTTPQTVRTSTSSFDPLRRHNPNHNSPLFETQSNLRYQASESSFAQTLDSPQIQRGEGITSSTNLLNGHAFDSVNSRRQSCDSHAEGTHADYDRLCIVDDTNDRPSNDSVNLLDTVGASEAHCTNIVTSSKEFKQEPTVSPGLGISSSTLTITHNKPSPKSRQTLTRHRTAAANMETESHDNNKIKNTTNERTEPLRRSLVIQQNLCSHTKLQHILGIGSPALGRSKPSRHNTQSPSMTMNEVLSKREHDRLGFVKKGSALFREKRMNLTDKVKAGWKVRPEDFQDSDDRN